jgi:cell division protein FtsW
MPVASGKSKSQWPTRVAWPREAGSPSLGAVPALVTAYPVRAYLGRSRFVLAPLSLTLDQLLFLITAALLCIGLVMVQSADSRIRGVVGGETGNWLTAAFNTKNAIHAGIAMVALTLLWRWDYRKLLGSGRGRFPLLMSPSTWLIVLTIGMLVAVLVTPLGREINGARRWLALGPIGFQPSELAKLSLVLFVSAYAVHRQAKVRSFFWGFLPLIVIFGIAAGLVVKEDFGTTVLIAAVVLVMILMAGCRWWHVGLLIPPAAVVIRHMLNTPFRRARLLAFLDPFADMKGAGYHPAESLLTIASGGFWGLGLGQGIQKMGYLPEDNTDFIFAVICEELGFFGALIVVALFLLFVIIGWRIASRCQNQFGKMVAFGITAMIGLQAAINIAVVTVTMPTKGIALPFISSGGTGWIMNAVAVGVLMSIERINRREIEARMMGDRDAEPALGFPVQVNAVPVAAAVPVVPAIESAA